MSTAKTITSGAVAASKCPFNTRQWTGVGETVGEHRILERSVIYAGAARNEDLGWPEHAKQIQLTRQQCFPTGRQPRFVAAHAAGLATGKNDGTEVHTLASVRTSRITLQASQLKMPSVITRARKPARPLSHSSAPAPSAKFIQ